MSPVYAALGYSSKGTGVILEGIRKPYDKQLIKSWGGDIFYPSEFEGDEYTGWVVSWGSSKSYKRPIRLVLSNKSSVRTP